MTAGTAGMAAITDDAGIVRVLALDHRDSLRAVLGEVATDDELIALKAHLVEAAAGSVSGVMLDPSYGMQPRCSSGCRSAWG